MLGRRYPAVPVKESILVCVHHLYCGMPAAEHMPCASVREPVLFSGTIRSAIAGYRDVTDEEVRAAAAAANAAVFIDAAPEGYATQARFVAHMLQIPRWPIMRWLDFTCYGPEHKDSGLIHWYRLRALR